LEGEAVEDLSEERLEEEAEQLETSAGTIRFFCPFEF
jgi:hypothetical protein